MPATTHGPLVAILLPQARRRLGKRAPQGLYRIAGKVQVHGSLEVALGYACDYCVGAGAADSGGKIFQSQRLETCLGGVVGDEFGAIARDGGLAFRIECRCDHEEAAVLIVAALEHRGDEQLFAPELFDRYVSRLRDAEGESSAG
jgi:hypothetical protein